MFPPLNQPSWCMSTRKEEKKSTESDIAFPDTSTFCLFFYSKMFHRGITPSWFTSVNFKQIFAPFPNSTGGKHTFFPEAKEALAAWSHSFAIILSIINQSQLILNSSLFSLHLPQATGSWHKFPKDLKSWQRETKLKQQKQSLKVKTKPFIHY